MKRLFTTFAVALLISTAGVGCAQLAQVTTGIATSMSSSTPSQITTLAEADQAATLVTNAVDVYVNTGTPNRAALDELDMLNEGLHTALTTLHTANAEGNSLTYAAFNAALKAFNSYATAQGIAH